MKKMLFNKEDEGAASGAASSAPDLSKVFEENFKKLEEKLGKLDKKIEAKNTPAPQKQKRVVEEEDDLNTLILTDPTKAVQKIKSQVESQVLESVSSVSAAKEQFQNKYAELMADYPEIGNMSSDIHVRAKEIMEETRSTQWDSGALERAVLRAAAEKGVLPVKHRKRPSEDEGENDYLGGASFSEGRGQGGSRRQGRSDKLPAATLAFAAELGMNTKDPKVVERLTKTYNERKGNWSRYR